MEQILAKSHFTSRLDSRSWDCSIITVLVIIFNHSLAFCFSSCSYQALRSLPLHTVQPNSNNIRYKIFFCKTQWLKKKKKTDKRKCGNASRCRCECKLKLHNPQEDPRRSLPWTWKSIGSWGPALLDTLVLPNQQKQESLLRYFEMVTQQSPKSVLLGHL